MTPRKPPNMSIQDWVERQIRTAADRGAFEDLAGKGEPIPDLDRPRPELAWVAGYLRRENTDATAVLPPALAIAKEVERLPARLGAERSEAAVRVAIGDLNDRIDREHARPQVGPPFRVKRVNVEAAVGQWRAERDAHAAAQAAIARPASVDTDEVPAARRRWWRRTRAQRARRSVAGSGSPSK